MNQHESPVHLYWIDYAGERKLYGTVSQGKSFTQVTYMTHPWLITDLTGKCISIYLPDARQSQFVIH